MGFQTQSVHSGQTYPMASMNAANGNDDTSLARQMSIYSLTLEEFQNSLGEPSKSFGSMNMDELLKNIWTAEESQAMVAAIGTVDGSATGISKQASLPRQGSSTLRSSLSRKTVDEVWKGICQAYDNNGGLSSSTKSVQQREMTFGEMTLEDFLVKAGVVKEEDAEVNTDQPFFSFGGNIGSGKTAAGQFESGDMLSPSVLPASRNVLPDLPFDKGMHTNTGRTVVQPANLLSSPYQNTASVQQQRHHGQLFQQLQTPEIGDVFPISGQQAGNGVLIAAPVGLGGLSSPVGGGIAASLNTAMNYGFNNGMSLAVPNFKTESPDSLSSDGTGQSAGNMQLSPVFQSGFTRSGPLKRLAEGPAERTFERRQCRMIKNRESAARSRARKQAYTVELENQLAQLREENLKLKKKQEEAEKRKKQVMDMIPVVSQQVQNEKRLLRTQTGPW